MPEPIKNFFSPQFINELAQNIQAAYKKFDTKGFEAFIQDQTWDSLELKARIRHITLALGKFLPQNYVQAIAIINVAIEAYGNWLDGFVLFFPDFVEVYGQGEESWNTSMAALEKYTVHASAEFAVRPFIINHEERMMAQMRTWATSDNEHVRRLASEGCRPALPWGQALQSFKKDPSPVLPILEMLKDDPAMYVRKSVANNLNDISKTHPKLVADIAKKWYGHTENTNWVVKHACRSLLKKGDPAVLDIFGFGNASAVEIEDFALCSQTAAIGGDISFSFTVRCKVDTKLRLEYAVDYVKANGKQNRKIFQISESEVRAGLIKPYVKKHSLANNSTRKHYVGKHAITLIANGAACKTYYFELMAT